MRLYDIDLLFHAYFAAIAPLCMFVCTPLWFIQSFQVNGRQRVFGMRHTLKKWLHSAHKSRASNAYDNQDQRKTHELKKNNNNNKIKPTKVLHIKSGPERNQCMFQVSTRLNLEWNKWSAVNNTQLRMQNILSITFLTLFRFQYVIFFSLLSAIKHNEKKAVQSTTIMSYSGNTAWVLRSVSACLRRARHCRCLSFSNYTIVCNICCFFFFFCSIRARALVIRFIHDHDSSTWRGTLFDFVVVSWSFRCHFNVLRNCDVLPFICLSHFQAFYTHFFLHDFVYSFAIVLTPFSSFIDHNIFIIIVFFSFLFFNFVGFCSPILFRFHMNVCCAFFFVVSICPLNKLCMHVCCRFAYHAEIYVYQFAMQCVRGLSLIFHIIRPLESCLFNVTQPIIECIRYL